jgi:gamma-glutamyl-gamma-aminobutyrate hydrolase PuuD
VPENYLRSLHAAGALSLTAWMGTGVTDSLLDVADGVLLIGGGDIARESFAAPGEAEAVDRQRDDFESALVDAARDRRLPLLGMCRGVQQLNVALGGTLRRVEEHRQDEDLAQPTHAVSVSPGSRMAGVFGMGELKVNSFHRWAVDRPGDEISVVATAPDGVAEGIESTGEWWAMGVQWHAELLEDQSTRSLFQAFAAAMRDG